MTARLVYVTGPAGSPVRAEACAWLRAQGFTITSTERPGGSYADRLRRDAEAIVDSDAVAFLPGSQVSPEALADYETARALGLGMLRVHTPTSGVWASEHTAEELGAFLGVTP